MQCPKCKKNTLTYLAWLPLYQCKNPKCGYRGPIGLKKIKRYKT